MKKKWKKKIRICMACNNAIMESERFCVSPGGEYLHADECPPRIRRRKAVVRNRKILNLKKKDPEGRRILNDKPDEDTLNKIKINIPIFLELEGAMVSSHNIICCLCRNRMILGNNEMRRQGKKGWEWAHSGCVEKTRKAMARYDSIVS